MLFFEWAPVSVVPCLTALYAIPPNRQEPRCDGRRLEVGIAQPRNSSLDLSASWRTVSCFLNLNRSFADATVNIADIGRVGVAIVPLRNIWPKLARRADSVEASVSGLTTSGHDRSEEPRPGGREELSRTCPNELNDWQEKRRRKLFVLIPTSPVVRGATRHSGHRVEDLSWGPRSWLLLAPVFLGCSVEWLNNSFSSSGREKAAKAHILFTAAKLDTYNWFKL